MTKEIAADTLTAESIRLYLPPDLPIAALSVLDTVPSTNTALKAAAAAGAPAGTVLIAAAQTNGRGRRGRSFYSPGGTGLYISVLLRPDFAPEMAIRITTAAAVAAARAIFDVTGKDALIKWVNDLYLDGKKITGILTESALSADGERLEYAVLGIGVNVTEPDGGFPPEIRQIAGALLDEPIPDGRAKIAASFLSHFFRLYETIGTDTAYMDEYRRRCFVIGSPITVHRGGAQRSVPRRKKDHGNPYGIRAFCGRRTARIRRPRHRRERNGARRRIPPRDPTDRGRAS